jgi:hypothetical protein
MPRRTLKVCSQPGCPELTHARHCATHASAYEQRRGRRQARGYDRAHEQLRAKWKRKVDRCEVNCARCGLLILPISEWALDHTDDRTGYLGPSHSTCNNRAGGLAAHQT